MPDSIEALAYEAGLRALDSQNATLESLRTRAATVLSAAALVTAFLGGIALAAPTLSNGQVQRQALAGWSWVAIAAFIGVVFLSLTILFPYRLTSQLSATRVLKYADAPDPQLTDVQRDIARYSEKHHRGNRRLLFWLFLAFGASSVLLLLEAVAWIVNLTH